MSDLITGITTAIDIAKKLRDLNKKVGEAEFKTLLAELYSELGDAKLEATNLKSDLADRKREIVDLKAQVNQREQESPVVEQGAYKFPGDDNLYCTACFVARKQKVPLTEQIGAWAQLGKWLCPVCKAYYGAKDQIPLSGGITR